LFSHSSFILLVQIKAYFSGQCQSNILIVGYPYFSLQYDNIDMKKTIQSHMTSKTWIINKMRSLNNGIYGKNNDNKIFSKLSYD